MKISKLFGAVMIATLLAAPGCAAETDEDGDEASSATEEALSASVHWDAIEDDGGWCGYTDDQQWVRKGFQPPGTWHKTTGFFGANVGVKDGGVYLLLRARRPQDRTDRNNAIVTRIFPDGTRETVKTADNLRFQAATSEMFQLLPIKWPSARKGPKRGMRYEVKVVFDVRDVGDPSCTQTIDVR